ncbi:QacE family quaternary ammonium compound efflux SMR transporter [Lysobacter pythonis]|uniref:QacE family quaternary ammonium compound efflux SMR transporter n=1 Tax=Solilutibacter pythonis TaxID=2483112 RepID=A0A3M2I7B7_9GAMM|nr:multidrug efflux SMR transporter [Lysobacter pythonis]RMH94174.1 QacE family quaternary ammonium compound efflux SMR transporter [Lysobacter pythonis]
MHWTYLAIAIVAEVIATSFLKSSQGFTRLAPTLTSVAGYAVAFYFLSLTLKTVPVGIAYAVWVGAGIVLITAVGFFFLGQKLDLAAGIGITLILGGVLVINLFSKTVSH